MTFIERTDAAMVRPTMNLLVVRVGVSVGIDLKELGLRCRNV